MDKLKYSLDSDGIYKSLDHVVHSVQNYDEEGFDSLVRMQEAHFWYRGRHRFLLGSLDRFSHRLPTKMKAIDLGGGVGGWVKFLEQRRFHMFDQLALADSSLVALSLAESVLPPNIHRYQVDLLNLKMRDEWDVAFLLDVIEHVPDDKRVLLQVKEALKPGGMLFVSVPAFQKFWSYNDDLAHHLRRYTRKDFEHIADNTDLTLMDSRYFMFFLSPLYLMSRLKPGIDKLNRNEKKELMRKQHQIPSGPINTMLSMLFCAETPIGHKLHFPWGTSLLGVFRKPM